MIDRQSDQKIYRINSTRTNFIYTSESPEEANIVYNSSLCDMAQFINNERKHNHIEYEELYEAHFNPIAEDLEDEISNRIKIQSGGCFVSICRGISIFMSILVFIFILSFSIFFSTKYAYETKPNLTLVEFLNHRNFLIEKYAKIPKYIIPKQIHLVFHPRFDEAVSYTTNDLEEFAYKGQIYVTVVSKKSNNKRIELNVKNLKVTEVNVYRSLTWTSIDFDDDPDINSGDIKYIVLQRNKRDVTQMEMNETTDSTNNDGSDVTESDVNDDENLNNEKNLFENESIGKNKTYFYPKFDTENFAPIKVIDVEADEKNDKIIIYLATEMAKDVYYVVQAKFYGRMTHEKGFYYTYYDDVNEPEEADSEDYKTHTKYFATTFIEPKNARFLFPCFDDHIFRTPFDITVSRLSNMSTESSPDLEDKEVVIDGKLFVDEYNATSSMKASEVGFAITNMNPHMYQFNDSLSIIFYTRNLHFKNTKFASNQINNIVEALENYLDQKFPHKKLKYVTVPNSDLTLSEIKNGMIISSEMHILIDKNYTTFSENYVCEQLSLHLSQVWIHNYVSFKTREHYWLHDALGLFLQTVSLFELGKTSQAEHLILEDRLDALLNELNYKSTSLQYFSQHDIEDKDYYNFIKKKGASILRMFNYTLSKDVLKSAIKKYFTKMSDMEYADFIESFNLTQIDCSHIPRGLNVSDFMKRWVSSEKYPIVTVHKTNGSIVLHQTSYVEDEDAPKQTWSIPISFTNSTSKNFTAGFDYWLMEDNYTIIHNAYSVDDENSWILVNAMGRGYYRTNYDEDNWKKIIRQLKLDHNIFPDQTRAILIDDALNLARMNMLDYEIAFDLLSYLMDDVKDEVTLHPWLSALKNLNYLYKTMEEQPNFYVVENFMRSIVNAVYNKINDLKYSRDLTEDDEEKRLEYLIDDNSCMLGYPECISDMKKKFEKMLLTKDEVNNQLLLSQNQSQDELFRILCTTIKYSGFFEWNIVYKSFNLSSDLNHRKILLRSLGCSREISLINFYINFLVQKEFFKFSSDILHSLSENKIGMKYCLDYLSLNWKTIIEILDINQLSVIFNNISNENEFKVLQEIFSSHPETFRHRDKDILRRCRDTIVSKLNWKRKIGQYI